jgi:hypothetical protein
MNSTHGTVIIRGENTIKLEALRPESLENRDIIVFGMSTRRYHLYFSFEEVEKRIAENERKSR